MTYLQPWMLWVLPAALLPIVIHLLNRLRYKTVHWAAMIFLLKANRASTRRAKIRQYILVALRCLVILFLVWAMARPLIGGWIGSAAGGAPEAVLILLDRSASMEARGAEQPESRREHALSLLAQAAKQSAGSRFVLIENVLREPLEIADASTLPTMRMAEATDTAADVPAMMRTALDYFAKNKPGSAELWIASDLQASNWRPDSGEWQDIAARFAGLTQDVRVRVVDLSAAPGRNLSVAVRAAELRVRDPKSGKSQLTVGLELKSASEFKGTLPLLITRDGAKSQSDVAMAGATMRQTLKFDLPNAEPGWGKVELPADDHAGDNTAFFVHAPPVALQTVVVGEGSAVGRLRLGAAPDPTRTDRSAVAVPLSQTSGIDWKTTALIVWTAAAPEGDAAKALQAWVESGGVLVAFPPASDAAGPLGIAWGAMESAERTAPFRVTAWDELDGPLARTDSGASLPVARLEVRQRQVPVLGEAAHVYGTFGDGRAFLAGRKIGAGTVFACATLPDGDWSTLGDGFVMLPMLQRALVLGGRRIAPPAMGIAGEWNPPDAQQSWTAVESDRARDWRWHAGIYQSGGKRVALNRPDAEDAPDAVSGARLGELLKGVKLTVIGGAMELKADRLQSEIWPAMLILTMFLMCAEMLLATSKAMAPVKPVARATPAVRPRDREAAEVAA